MAAYRGTADGREWVDVKSYDRLKAEVERLNGLLEGRVDVTEIHLADGSLDLLGTHPLIPAIATEMAEMLSHGPGNHVAMSARDKTGQEFSIVVQRSYGKTPEQRIRELQEQLGAVREWYQKCNVQLPAVEQGPVFPIINEENWKELRDIFERKQG